MLAFFYNNWHRKLSALHARPQQLLLTSRSQLLFLWTWAAYAARRNGALTAAGPAAAFTRLINPLHPTFPARFDFPATCVPAFFPWQDLVLKWKPTYRPYRVLWFLWVYHLQHPAMLIADGLAYHNKQVKRCFRWGVWPHWPTFRSCRQPINLPYRLAFELVYYAKVYSLPR